MITGIDTEAPVIVRRATTIDAPIGHVWARHTDINAWPAWQPEITAARVDDPLRPGTVFRWTTAGLEIASTVYAVERPRRILWGGDAHGITGIHLWTFDERDGVVHVHTEESWDGGPVRTDVEAMRIALDGSLASWLDHLRKASEGG
ncbi:SRPBCC family protein [Actinomadura meridiana]|uniref:SRPBCC family protein n=1 Tax=Actinomadura meridiana TaxID=559626 RepID=A0ABP8C4L0_9ACTN